MQPEDYGLGREERKGAMIYFKDYRVIERGRNAGYVEARRGNGQMVLISPDGILRWPKDSEPLTKKQLEMMDVARTAIRAINKGKKGR